MICHASFYTDVTQNYRCSLQEAGDFVSNLNNRHDTNQAMTTTMTGLQTHQQLRRNLLLALLCSGVLSVDGFTPQARIFGVANPGGRTILHVLADHNSRSFVNGKASPEPSDKNGRHQPQDDLDRETTEMKQAASAAILEMERQMLEDTAEEAGALQHEQRAEEVLEADLCVIEPFETERQQAVGMSRMIDNAIHLIPAVFPVMAYLLYDPIAEAFAALMNSLSNNNWVAVDGGAYKAKIIAPAINGVVVPSVSILFATLIGNTIGVLRERQLNICNSINVEAGQLRMLQFLFDTFPDGKIRDKCRFYLLRYSSRIISEGQETVDVNTLDGLSGMDSELNGIFAELNALSWQTSNSVPANIVGESYSACRRLYEERSRRITYMQSTFPVLHYVLVGTLATSICVAFLMETNQELLVFLNAVQLRILWSVLVGTFSALAVVSYDLSNPFRGSYQISRCVDQLYTIRASLKASMEKDRSTGWK